MRGTCWGELLGTGEGVDMEAERRLLVVRRVESVNALGNFDESVVEVSIPADTLSLNDCGLQTNVRGVR